MTKIYQPTAKEELIKDEQGFTENDHENAKIAEHNLMVKQHELFVKSEQRDYVIAIIDEWLSEITTPDQFTVEALTISTPEQIRDIMLLAAKCRLEADKLKRKLS